jgi:hypothetical protein
MPPGDYLGCMTAPATKRSLLLVDQLTSLLVAVAASGF